MKLKNRGFSLSWGLTGIIVACWLIPLLLVLASLTYYTTHSVRRQLDDSVKSAAANAAANCRRSVREAVTSSRGASYDGSVRDAYLTYKKVENSQLLYERLNSFLQTNYRYDDNFLSTMLFLTEEPENIYYTFNSLAGASYSNIIYYQHSVHDSVLTVSEQLDTGIAFVNSGGNLYMVRNIVDADYNRFAVIVSQLNNEAFLGSFDNIAWEDNSTIYFNGVAVNTDPDSDYIAVPDTLRLSEGMQVTVEDAGAIHIYGREQTDCVEIIYAVKLDMQSFWRGFRDFTGIFYVLLVMTIPLLGLAVRFFYLNIVKPIRRLHAAAEAIQNGELGYRISCRASSHEFTYLNDSFNEMSVKLKQQFERIYSEELALRDARIMALQSQINPHFLNNTLEIINWEVRLGNNAKVLNMIEALATMLDAAMDRKSSPLVSLAQEMMYVDSYLYIISERFGKRLTVKNEIDSSLLQYQVPRLIMQPIIENAIEHGLGANQAGEITLRADSDGAFMMLSVKNNGIMSEKDKKLVAKLLSPDYDTKSSGSLHLGIHNVNLRLQMIYGSRSGLSVTSDETCTISSFSIPLSKNDDVF